MGWLRAKWHLADYGRFHKELRAELKGQIPPNVEWAEWIHTPEGLAHAGAEFAVAQAEDSISHDPLQVFIFDSFCRVDKTHPAFVAGHDRMERRILAKAIELGVIY